MILWPTLKKQGHRQQQHVHPVPVGVEGQRSESQPSRRGDVAEAAEHEEHGDRDRQEGEQERERVK